MNNRALDRHRSSVGARRKRLEWVLREAVARDRRAATEQQKAMLWDALMSVARDELGIGIGQDGGAA